ncbi:flagellar FlbD family protein, partial [Intestinimonas aquisgranensis]
VCSSDVRRRPIDEKENAMITLQKMNGERFLLNHNQIEYIELIPESKIVMMNHDYYLVRDTIEEIIQKIAEYNAKVQDIHREISVTNRC